MYVYLEFVFSKEHLCYGCIQVILTILYHYQIFILRETLSKI